MNKLFLASLAAVPLLLGGCGGEPKEAAEGNSPAAEVTDLAAKAGPESQEVLNELTAAVNRCWAAQGKVPASLDQVVAAGYLKSVPELPAGKRYLIDPRSGQVYISPR